MNILVVGSGLSGATIARKFAEAGSVVKVIDKRNHIGGNVYDYKDTDTGIIVNKYGAHIFHTNDDEVWQFVNKYSKWRPYEHRVLSYVNNKFVPVPVNIQTVNEIFELDIQTEQEMNNWLDGVQYKGAITNSEEAAKARVGDELYELMFENYTQKQWAKHPTELEPSVLERIPVRSNNDDRYFNDTYEALPENGYTEFVNNLLNHKNITIKLNTEYNNNLSDRADITIFTGKIDNYFKEKYGELEYRSLYFEYEIVPVEDYQPRAVVNYPSLDYKYTRIIDYKKFYNISSKYSLIVKEYSTDKGESYYPVPTPRNRDLYKKYQQEAERLEKTGIYFIGRLAEYKYYNMDQAIKSALKLYNKLTTKQVK